MGIFDMDRQTLIRLQVQCDVMQAHTDGLPNLSLKVV